MSVKTMSSSRERFVIGACLLGLLLAPACTIYSLKTRSLTVEAQDVTSPVKVHLSDGTTLVFAEGVVI